MARQPAERRPGKRTQMFLFGTFALAGAAGPIQLHTRRIESLLAYLVLHPEPHAREKLAALIWGEASACALNLERRCHVNVNQA